jgi:hypothetical protein
VLFDSIHHVLAAERRLKQTDLWFDLVPVPRSLSSDCGIAIEFRLDDLDRIREIVTEQGRPWRAIHLPTTDGYRQAAP